MRMEIILCGFCSAHNVISKAAKHYALEYIFPYYGIQYDLFCEILNILLTFSYLCYSNH